MAGFEVWDVVKVPFPYTNRPVLQHRPALVISVLSDAGGPGLLWVLMITSAVHRRWDGDVEVLAMGGTGLPVASVVRTAKIATVEAADAGVIGSVSEAVRVGVAAAVRSGLAAVLRVAC